MTGLLAGILAASLVAAAASALPEVTKCGPEQAGWRAAALQEIPDLSFLNHKPAGRHGFVRAQGESFVFEDGTPARFWGANVTADAIFQTPEALIEAEAKRIAQLGFNLVRLHHHDSGGWVQPNVIAAQGAELLNPLALRRFDVWIASLKAQGVYVWLDIHTGRVFRPDQGIPGFPELRSRRHGPNWKGFLYVNPRIQQLTLEFADEFLGHRNAITGLRYREDPAIAGVLVTNENDLSQHYGNLFAANKNKPWHRERFLEQAAQYEKSSGFSLDSITRTWEPGPSKLFLADLEQRTAARFREHLRKAGVRAPIAFTSYWGSSGTNALPALSRGDMIDVHSYGIGDALRTDPRKQLGLLGWIAAGHVAGKPLTVSEWNQGKPLQQARFAPQLWVASIAALQDWDALMLFAYSQKSFARPRAMLWNAARDPAQLPLLPPAALVFRRADVAAAKQRVVLAPSRADVFERPGAPQRFAAIPSLLEQHRVSISLPVVRELPWLTPIEPGAGERTRDLATPRLAADATRVVSDTGEIVREFTRGVALVDTPRTQFATGALSSGPLQLSLVRIESRTDAAVAFSSLDGAPLARSKQILVSIAARACPTTKRDPLWRMQPIDGRAWLKLDGARQLRPLDPASETVRLARDERGLVVPLDFRGGWAVIEPPR